jgi:hypothetical protein
MADEKVLEEYVQNEYGMLVGKTIASVRLMTEAEEMTMAWPHGGWRVPVVFVFTDGSVMVPMSDDEGNEPGALAVGGPEMLVPEEEPPTVRAAVLPLA